MRWVCRAPSGEPVALHGRLNGDSRPRECFDPRVEVRTYYWPGFVVVTGDLVEVDLPAGEEGVFAWLPIADPTHAMREAQAQEDTRVAEEGSILAERYARETARQHEEYLRSHRAAWEKRAEGLWWVMGGNSGMITAADPPFLPGVHHGLSAARRALEAYLLRENRGLTPGSWIAANVCWNGYACQAVALQEREGGPDEVAPA